MRSGPKSVGFDTTSIEVSHAHCRPRDTSWGLMAAYHSAPRHLSEASEHTATVAFHVTLVSVERFYAAWS